ncbi:hypothetical protein ElyMa_002514000, partial [Elysia marginata]
MMKAQRAFFPERAGYGRSLCALHHAPATRLVQTIRVSPDKRRVLADEKIQYTRRQQTQIRSLRVLSYSSDGEARHGLFFRLLRTIENKASWLFFW